MDIIEDIRAAFTSSIGDVAWMDDETREAARRKVYTGPNIVAQSSVLAVYVLSDLRLRIRSVMLLS